MGNKTKHFKSYSAIFISGIVNMHIRLLKYYSIHSLTVFVSNKLIGEFEEINKETTILFRFEPYSELLLSTSEYVTVNILLCD